MTNAMKAAVLILAAAFLLGFADAASEPRATREFVTVVETHKVARGDTLWEISELYASKSGVRRDIREFQQGIVEINYDLFRGRTPYMVFPGDELTIRYVKAVEK